MHPNRSSKKCSFPGIFLPSSQRLWQAEMCCWLNSIFVMLNAAHSLEGPLQRSFSFSPLPRSFRFEDRFTVMSSSSDSGSEHTTSNRMQPCGKSEEWQVNKICPKCQTLGVVDPELPYVFWIRSRLFREFRIWSQVKPHFRNSKYLLNFSKKLVPVSI